MVLSGVPMEVSNDTVAKVLNTVKVFGRTKIQCRHGNSTSRGLFILVEANAELDSC